ncbi:DUF2526 family protein [Shimwellia blattae]|nr:DUF2526 family protein [Shimwellia blattae]GAB80777.1 hypothetical protein YdcY [Shimwellia blattae DSM 4481 = NBRC 105725]VDY64594.1 Protein of uncharacterised function (DUF2526) [Shimwellia blattae]VEC22702.1 Protein of uncharacterised function (DUF2526) [Shimwellia blattae]
MSHFDDVKVQVDAALQENVIAHMNELLVALSDDDQLSREQRYQQQQRLRVAVAHHGKSEREDARAPEDERREHLTRGGKIA